MQTRRVVWLSIFVIFFTVQALNAPSLPSAYADTIPVALPSDEIVPTNCPGSDEGPATSRCGNATIPLPIPNCTLRDAIIAANTDTATGGCPAGNGPDIIELAAGATYTLTVVDNTDPSLGPNGLPIITSDITINGNGATILRSSADGTPEFRFFQVNSFSTLRLNGVTLSNGKVSGGFLGGALYNRGVIYMENGVLAGNRADNNGGGLFNSSEAAFSATNSTLSGNSALNGGAIFNWGSVLIINSTLTGNSASFGGGLNNGSGTAVFTNSTVAANSASTTGGNIYNAASNKVTLRNTIVATPTAGGNCDGSITDGGGNLRWPESDTSCVGIFGNPRLGPLAHNGGPTQTMALQSGSAALEKGIKGICDAAPVNNLDQRGVTRPSPANTLCDIGAFESSLRPIPFLVKSFNPVIVLAEQPSTITFNITNPNSTGAGLTGVAFTDTLPINLVIANQPNVKNGCGGIVTAVGGGGIITVAGGILLPTASCTIGLDVLSPVPGAYTNTTGPVSSTESGAGDPSNTALLIVAKNVYFYRIPFLSR